MLDRACQENQPTETLSNTNASMQISLSPPESAMNIERHTQEFIPVSPSLDNQRVQCDAWSQILPPLLKSGGLANIPHTTLRENLKPVLSALERLDAELLLDLQPSERGPRVRQG
jgi:hypothetical protein